MELNRSMFIIHTGKGSKKEASSVHRVPQALTGNRLPSTLDAGAWDPMKWIKTEQD